MHNFTDAEIEQAKRATNYIDNDTAYHQHPDCIRIAYQWLDAQTKTMQPNKRSGWAIKHLIERWGGRYVSQSDVEVAAHLHPDIEGRYPYFNISSRLMDPNISRLEGIPEAFQHMNYRDQHDFPTRIYKRTEK
ncbi:hypothetical protein [Desulfogranum marinum]|uniref:hypothetical protein n=1 Tax=Desulfogranum marinum TaxID=453220 RepID=UPI0019658559|nr:hypothetical protein [Desulfogranum marinum]MBM9515039.1 hypothetical protein [Desulfogranum marinum]